MSECASIVSCVPYVPYDPESRPYVLNRGLATSGRRSEIVVEIRVDSPRQLFTSSRRRSVHRKDFTTGGRQMLQVTEDCSAGLALLGQESSDRLLIPCRGPGPWVSSLVTPLRKSVCSSLSTYEVGCSRHYHLWTVIVTEVRLIIRLWCLG